MPEMRSSEYWFGKEWLLLLRGGGRVWACLNGEWYGCLHVLNLPFRSRIYTG